MRTTLATLLCACCLTSQELSREQKEDLIKRGHSHQGPAFDTGPREKPWVIEGIGKSHFPITTSNPEVQKWFDQGHTLLHSFWYFEAERAFRWCLKLEPENAMAYWGLARAANDGERSRSFLKEAVKRKDKVSERERLYIEAWAERELEHPTRPADSRERNRRFTEMLEHITLKFPNDVEAKALLGLSTMFEGSRYAPDLILKQVIAKQPEHPGAHHYRIHNWNHREGEQALDSCATYGRISSGIGHAQHMPGHVYSTLGMWHEAAISMDTATRVEKQYMRTRLIFPWNDWNYTHNANYLSFIHTQLGMAGEALSGARQLLAVAGDPQKGDRFGTHWQGTLALMRALVRFERWDEILDKKTFSWQENARDKAYRAYLEGLAHLGRKDLVKAEEQYVTHRKLKAGFDTGEFTWMKETYAIQGLELRGRIEVARGEALTGIAALTEAAEREQKLREQQNDPPFYPVIVYNVLGRAYLDRKSPTMAVPAYEKALEGAKNDGFALAGLVEAYSALGEKEKARKAMARLAAVWSDADPGLKDLERARALAGDVRPAAEVPAAERNYRKTTLDQFGPNLWEPYPAPKLSVVDSKSKPVTLEEYAGKNVLLIFYLGEECVHCLQQLNSVAGQKAEFAKLDTELVAVSSAPPEKNAASQRMSTMPFRLLSDSNFENARRFKSYDDFEELELHSTILIDKLGRVHWAKSGGEPFNDVAFLLKEIARMNEIASKAAGTMK